MSNIVYKNRDDLIKYINNARMHSGDQIDKIASSIKEFGFINPIIIDNENNIIAGHGRLEAAKKLKLERVPCLVFDHLTKAQKKAYILADNRIAELSEWDNDLLKIELESLKEMDFNIDLTGFGDFEFGDFEAGSVEDQHKLDEKKLVFLKCPHCGNGFEQSDAIKIKD